MRLAALTVLMGVVSVVPAFACGAPQVIPTSQTFVPTILVYDKGWVIPGLAGASVLRRYRDETGSEVLVYRTTTQVEVALQGFEVSRDGKSIHFIPGYVQGVDGTSGDIWEYRVDGRTYAYDVVTVSLHKAEPPIWQQVIAQPQLRNGKNSRQIPAGVLGCGFTTLRYFDADGDGIFESLQYVGFGFGAPGGSSAQCPTTPEWALRLLPNRAAAERCARQFTRNLDKFEIPPELRAVFTYQPAIPVLAPAKQ